MKRRRISRGRSRRMFSQTGKRTHVKNVSPRPMRGGYRL